jgi:hypothetical protein
MDVSGVKDPRGVFTVVTGAVTSPDGSLPYPEPPDDSPQADTTADNRTARINTLKDTVNFLIKRSHFFWQ